MEHRILVSTLTSYPLFTFSANKSDDKKSTCECWCIKTE